MLGFNFDNSGDSGNSGNLSLNPVRPIQRPVLNGFSDVLALNLRTAFHVGNGPRDFQYPVMGPRA
jgi:hypothetical protein